MRLSSANNESSVVVYSASRSSRNVGNQILSVPIDLYFFMHTEEVNGNRNSSKITNIVQKC